jgi:hypothetical protein
MSELGSKADMLLRPQNDTRMNDQSVGSVSRLNFAIPGNAFLRCDKHATLFRVSHGYSKNALGGDRESGMWPSELNWRLNYGKARCSPRMDCTGREGTEETLEGEDTRRGNLQSSKAHARCTQAKGAQSWNFGWASSASKEANSAVLNALHAYCPNG